MDTKEQSRMLSWLWSRTGLVLIGFLGIVAFFLITEHQAHLFGFLPFLLLLLCPLLHWLMHGGHGHGDAEHSARGRDHEHGPGGDRQ